MCVKNQYLASYCAYKLMGFGCELLQDAELLPRKRLRSPNIPPTDPDIERRIFAQLSSGIDGAFRKIDAFLEEKGLVNVDTPRHGTNLREVEGRTVLELFVTTVLPCKWEIASSGVWRFYTGFQKHFGPVHNKMTQVRTRPRCKSIAKVQPALLTSDCI